MRQTRTTGTNLQTTVPEDATLGINFHGVPNDACGTEETGLARVQLDPLNYVDLYSVAFFVPGANPSTDVCKSSDGGVTYEELSSCSGSNSAPCIASESGGLGGRNYVLDLLPGDPNIDFS